MLLFLGVFLDLGSRQAARNRRRQWQCPAWCRSGFFAAPEPALAALCCAARRGADPDPPVHCCPPRWLGAAPRRFAGLCKLKKEMYEQYTQLHDHTWDEVMEKMYNANMRNFVVRAVY